jgi:hypothetical protein
MKRESTTGNQKSTGNSKGVGRGWHGDSKGHAEAGRHSHDHSGRTRRGSYITSRSKSHDNLDFNGGMHSASQMDDDGNL